ncbi:MAG: hypothetical protein KatS3mg081_2213 [Gemmatimonadales bacterium]|nr:MAG: hypothetical protein KatS3mg081_2213 [Gemmatimonadales bacterium]
MLAWLLGEPSEAEVRRALEGAERVVTSKLTGLECAGRWPAGWHQAA